MATKLKKQPAAEPIMKRWNVFMPPAMLEALESVATKKGATSAELVRAATRSYLKRHGYYV
jgi:metal-responsive CopG/Arc/MetJ family transcriptional regulator